MNFLQAPLKSTFDIATSELDPPFAVIDLDAFDHNASDLLRRASGVPLRLASKSLRVRALQDRALAAGFVGTLCFTLPEALWLAENGSDDLVVGYPTVDRKALRALAHDPVAYRDVYLSWLKHRHVVVLDMDRQLTAAESVYVVDAIAGELAPAKDEVEKAMRIVESAGHEDPPS